jgi:hypothetical protein
VLALDEVRGHLGGLRVVERRAPAGAFACMSFAVAATRSSLATPLLFATSASV